MPRAPHRGSGETRYELYFGSRPRRFVWQIRDHGVWLGADAIGWAAADGPRRRRLDQIDAVHLTRGGEYVAGTDGPTLMRVVADRRTPYTSSCRITFRDGADIVVFDGDSQGIADPEREAAYSRFVLELHARLRPFAAGIGFTAGYSEARYRVLQVLLPVMALLVAGAALALLLGQSGRVFVVAAAGIGLFFQWKMMRANAPRRYDPERVPPELLPAAALRDSPLSGFAAAPEAARPAPTSAWRDAPPALLAGFAAAPPWLLRVAVPAGLLVALALLLVWLAGIRETERMFAPGEAQRVYRVLEERIGGSPQLRRLTLTPEALTILAEAPQSHTDARGLSSNNVSMTLTHASLFGGWREWDRVSGPNPEPSQAIGDAAVTQPFRMRPEEIPDLAQLGRAALARAGFEEAGGMRRASLENRSPERLGEAGYKWRWTVEAATPRESAKVFFDRDGRLTGADLSGTLRVSRRNYLAGGAELAAAVRAMRAALGGDPIVAYLRIEAKTIRLRTGRKDYEAGPEGVTDMTAPFSICGMTTDQQAGRFSLDRVDWSRLPALANEAHDAIDTQYRMVEDITLRVPEDGGDMRWAVDVRSFPGGLSRVTFDQTGRRLDIDSSGAHACE